MRHGGRSEEMSNTDDLEVAADTWSVVRVQHVRPLLSNANQTRGPALMRPSPLAAVSPCLPLTVPPTISTGLC